MNPSDVVTTSSQWSPFDFWHRKKRLLMSNIFHPGNDTVSVMVTTCCRKSKISYTSVMVWSSAVWDRVMWVAFVVSEAEGLRLWNFIWWANILNSWVWYETSCLVGYIWTPVTPACTQNAPTGLFSMCCMWNFLCGCQSFCEWHSLNDMF